MSLEYAIEYPCRMRERFGESGLRALARTCSLISRMVNETIEGTHPPTEESIQFAKRFSDDLEKGEEIAVYCRRNCPIQMDSDLGGSNDSLVEPGFAGNPEQIACLGRIHYPIEARFERFLADRLQLLFDTIPDQRWPHLLAILADAESPFDGEWTKELRRVTTDEGLRFFELRVPISLARRAVRLTTDNVFDLLGGFSATDGGKSGYQRELPVIALNDYAEFLEALLIDDLSIGERMRLSSMSSSYVQYLRFTRAIRQAEKLGVRILLD